MKQNDFKKIIICCLIFILGCGTMYGMVSLFPEIFVKGVILEEKNVSITDTGIADSVDKVYDSVVIVKAGSSLGTGFVYKTYDNTAYIVTNAHVVSGQSDIKISLSNGKEYSVSLVGYDDLSDIAVLSIDKSNIISIAQIGSSDNMRIGDTIFAVGTPLDVTYAGTVTKGIISGKERMVPVTISSTYDEYVMKVIQIDASINPGNSGGPLCNVNGEVIGVTSLKFVDSSVEGMGFAIPIETVSKYANDLIKSGKITYPEIGITTYNVKDIVKRGMYTDITNKNNATEGIFIVDVIKNKPAYKSGLQSNDIIITIDGKETPSLGYFRYYLYNDYKKGDKIKLTVLRDGKKHNLEMTLE